MSSSTHEIAFEPRKVPEERSRDYWLRVYHIRSKKTLWRGRMEYHQNPQWFSEGQVLILDVSGGLLVCSLRRPGRIFHLHTPFNDDYIFGKHALSPDQKFLLFRGGSSGSADVDVGTLYCLDMTNGKIQKIAYDVARMRWIGSRRAHYWTAILVPDRNILSPRPTVWQCPERLR